MMWRKMAGLGCVLLLSVTVNATGPDNVGETLRTWQKGVWLGGGTYTIWTDTHYFVVQGNTTNDSANVYCGASQVAFTDKGVARKQTVRVRKMPGQSWTISSDGAFEADGDETPLEIDESKFKPGTCVIDKGIIYDSVEEIGDDHILLSTCNGDKIKLLNNGVSVYMPAGGGEYRSVRIETF